MLAGRRIRDKYTSWKKLFLQNWTLFRASRIGVVGLAIMLAFLIVAFAAPYVGLRDPLYWVAPEADTISVEPYWSQEVRPGTDLFGRNGSVDQSIAFRPYRDLGGIDTRVDRVYVPEGDRVFAIEAATSFLAWSTPFQADGVISVDPVFVNYGRIGDPSRSNFTLMFGTAAGSVYVIEDYTAGNNQPTPTAWSANFGAPISGLAALSADQTAGTTDRDGFVVGTSDGRVYSFTVNRSGTFGGRTFFGEVWNVTLPTPSPVHLAGSVIRTTSAVPTSSPCFYQSNTVADIGKTVVLGTGDGTVMSLFMSNGSLRWEHRVTTNPWSTPPTMRIGAEITGSPTLVYAATDDSKLFVLAADTGRPLPSWIDAAGNPEGAMSIFYPNRIVGTADTGAFSMPANFGSTIYVASTSGYLYAVTRDPVRGANNVIVRDAGDLLWAFRDPAFRHDTTFSTSFSSSPHVFDKLNFVVAAGSFNNGTTDPTDDLGTVYVFNTATGSLSWKWTFPYLIPSTPVSWRDLESQRHTHESVWFGTSRGDIYSYSVAGQYLAPLPPSWAHRYQDSNNVWHSGYPSGNSYILGTDARGRDIFSQLVWGSRVALLVGFASAFFTISIGVIIGLVAGYLGGRVESILMRFTDVILVIPGLPLVIILAAVLGAGIGNIILVIAIVGWPGVARVIRAEVLSLKERPFIDSARVTGASNVRIMFRHVAPNVAPLAFLYMTFAVSGAILTEAALSFIGLGDVSTISWGIMLQDVSQSKALQAWWWLLPPGLAITLISLAFFLVGRAFDEIVNPRLRKR